EIPFTGFRISQIQQSVFSESWMKGNFEKSAKSRYAYLRNSRNRQWIEDSAANDAKPPRSFGDEHVAIRQERDTPRIGKAGRDGADTDALHGRLKSLRQLRERRRSAAAPRAGDDG